jgi:hypothetical protein
MKADARLNTIPLWVAALMEGESKMSSAWCGARKASAAAKRMSEIFDSPSISAATLEDVKLFS